MTYILIFTCSAVVSFCTPVQVIERMPHLLAVAGDLMTSTPSDGLFRLYYMPCELRITSQLLANIDCYFNCQYVVVDLHGRCCFPASYH